MMLSKLRKAFTLPEILLAAMILGFCVSVILISYINSLNLNDSSRNLTIASSHAEFILEEIRNQPLDDVRRQIEAGEWFFNERRIAEKMLQPLKNELIRVEGSVEDPLKIKVTVTWKDKNSRERDYALKTIISG